MPLDDELDEPELFEPTEDEDEPELFEPTDEVDEPDPDEDEDDEVDPDELPPVEPLDELATGSAEAVTPAISPTVITPADVAAAAAASLAREVSREAGRLVMAATIVVRGSAPHQLSVKETSNPVRQWFGARRLGSPECAR